MEAWKHRDLEAWNQGITMNYKESQGILWNHMYHLLHMKAWKYEGMESNGITTQSLIIVLSNEWSKLFVGIICRNFITNFLLI